MSRSFFQIVTFAIGVFSLISCESGRVIQPVRRANGAQSVAENGTSSEPAYFILKQGVTSYFKSQPKNASELGGNYCNLKAEKKYTYSGHAVLNSKHYQITVTNSEFDCTFRTGYVFSEHVTLGGAEAQDGGASGSQSSFCQYSWEERPGTTDYTTFDSFRGTSVQGDRPQSETLIGSGVQKNRSICEKAQALRHCFHKAIIQSNEASAVRFREWAASHGIDPVRALMAKTEQETMLGSIKDTCSSGTCNGIGIAQIITALDENRRPLAVNDSRWDGITFNILTNLNYSVRVIAEKIPVSGSLYNLAYNYNGAAGAANYARKVEVYYNDLLACSL